MTTNSPSMARPADGQSLLSVSATEAADLNAGASSGWRHAATLIERSSARRRQAAFDAVPPPGDALARKRLQRWRSEGAFKSGSAFSRKLTVLGMNEPEFLALLGEPECAQPEPAWAVALTAAHQHDAIAGALDWSARWRGNPVIGVLDVVEPLISDAVGQVRAAAAALAGEHGARAVDAQASTALFMDMLPPMLIPLLMRTLTLELHVARLQGLLKGDSPQARFASFIERLRHREHAMALLQEYPVLARQLAEHVQTWADVSIEFLHHLHHDWDALNSQFGPAQGLGRLTEVRGGEGDRHRGGRSVFLLTFEHGTRLVYKPRSLAIERHFQALLQWFNERGLEAKFRTLHVLDRGDHGWVECVSMASCASEQELQRFYRRQGSYLALLYAICASDFHFENLIAAGEHPVMIDLEALFHPQNLGANAQGGNSSAQDAPPATILGVGLLPWRTREDKFGNSLDLGGLTATAGQVGEVLLGIDGAGTDDMRVVRRPRPTEGGQHLPTLNGNEANVFAHVHELGEGFAEMYRLILRHRDALLADGGPLLAFSGDEARVILRDTSAYAKLLQESFHPDLLRDALDRDRHFDQLWAAFTNTDRFDALIAAEQHDLLNGDVPMFTTQPGSASLWDSRRNCLNGILGEPALDSVHRRLAAFSEEDLASQLSLVNTSLATEATRRGQ